MASAPTAFGLPENAPEPFSVSKHYFLWLIALPHGFIASFFFSALPCLYIFAFKLLGIFLFAVEIIWFIGRPVFAEMKRWWTRRAMFSMNRQTRRTVVGISILLILAFAPWQTSITAPALIESILKAPVHLPNAAWLTSLYVTNGQAVKRVTH